MAGNIIASFGPAQVVTDGATQVFDCSGGGVFQWTLGASRTMSAPTNVASEQLIEIRVIQDATGSRLVTWPTTFAWPAATAPTLTVTAAKMDIVSGQWDSLNSKWRMKAANLNYTV
jgi:hypothetical protein